MANENQWPSYGGYQFQHDFGGRRTRNLFNPTTATMDDTDDTNVTNAAEAPETPETPEAPEVPEAPDAPNAPNAPNNTERVSILAHLNIDPCYPESIANASTDSTPAPEYRRPEPDGYWPSYWPGYSHRDAYRQRSRRPTTDYGTPILRWVQNRKMHRTPMEQERPGYSYVYNMMPPAARPDRPGDTIPAKHLHSSLNKIKHPINVVKWTPDGRRLLTGSSSGEFTLWNGMSFNFETIMSAHESAIRALKWTHYEEWLVSADQSGVVKYWQNNFNNVKVIQAHDDAVRDIAFAPTDVYYVTASDDSTLKLWDFSTGENISTFTGHGWDVKTCDWHPQKGLLISGSKDHLIKVWDPRSGGKCLSTFHNYKNTIHKVIFEPSLGHIFGSCAREPVARLFDIRMMREMVQLKGHDREITTITWHNVHRSLVSTGGGDGSIHHYILDDPSPPPGTPMPRNPYTYKDRMTAPTLICHPYYKVPYAHEQAIWSLDWHSPVGHILCSGSNDRVTRFWTRPRPGDRTYNKDRYHLGDAAAKAQGSWSSKAQRSNNRDESEQEQDDDGEALVDQNVSREPAVPGLSTAQPTQIPGMGRAPPPANAPSAPPAFPPLPGSSTNAPAAPDVARLAAMFTGPNSTVPPPAAPSGTFNPTLAPMPTAPAFSQQNAPGPGTFPPGLSHINFADPSTFPPGLSHIPVPGPSTFPPGLGQHAPGPSTFPPGLTQPAHGSSSIPVGFNQPIPRTSGADLASQPGWSMHGVRPEYVEPKPEEEQFPPGVKVVRMQWNRDPWKDGKTGEYIP